MSSRADFLGRLADRHHDAASAIMPRLPSLFEAAPGTAQPILPPPPAEQPALEDARPPSRPRPVQTMAQPAPHAVERMEPPGAPTQPARVQPRPQPARAERQEGGPSPLAVLAQAARVPAIAAISGAPPARRMPPDLPLERTAVASPAPLPTAAPAIAMPPAAPAATGIAPSRGALLPAGVLNPPAFLERLLPKREGAADVPVQRRASAPATSGPHAAPAAPSVHISIGRFEVRAEAAPPARKPDPARRASPLSLEDYFKRNGDRS